MNVVISMFCVNGTLRKGRVEKEQVQNSDCIKWRMNPI